MGEDINKMKKVDILALILLGLTIFMTILKLTKTWGFEDVSWIFVLAPIFFYMLLFFIFTLIIFLFVTTVLIFSLLNEKKIKENKIKKRVKYEKNIN